MRAGQFSLVVGVKCDSAQVADQSARQISFWRIIGHKREGGGGEGEAACSAVVAACQLIPDRTEIEYLRLHPLRVEELAASNIVISSRERASAFPPRSLLLFLLLRPSSSPLRLLKILINTERAHVRVDRANSAAPF